MAEEGMAKGSFKIERIEGSAPQIRNSDATEDKVYNITGNEPEMHYDDMDEAKKALHSDPREAERIAGQARALLERVPKPLRDRIVKKLDANGMLNDPTIVRGLSDVVDRYRDLMGELDADDPLPLRKAQQKQAELAAKDAVSKLVWDAEQRWIRKHKTGIDRIGG